ncbi:MAG: hypothetical protein JXB00_14605 [Bacteroidales bacterium]|nr:hypothetical protein [Bacteroidales bacterium]
MEIKGSAVKSIVEFIKKNYPEKYQEWFESLPEQSKKIFSEPVLPSNWYPVEEAAVVPTQHLADMFFNSDAEAGAWKAGRFSAEVALTGIYKFFVMAASPHFIISKASKILSTYYRPGDLQVVQKGDKWVMLHFSNFEEANKVVENRVCGWIERALEISGAKEVKVNIRKSVTKGDDLTELYMTWN